MFELRFRASRDVTVDATGEHSVQVKYYDIYNAPGEIVKEMLASNEPVIVYKNWLKSICEPDERYDTKYLDDLKDAVGDRIRQLDAWIVLMEKEGYTIDVVEL
jgi:hypothetical protein